MASFHNLTNTHNQANQHHPRTTNLIITAINVNSLVTIQKRFDVLDLARATNSDIMLISETKFNAKHQFNPADYNLIRTDRPAAMAGGGTAILIKNNINYEHIRHPSSLSNKLIEYSIVKLHLNNSSLYIISLYATNDGSSATFINELVELLDGIKANLPSTYYVIAGDPNIKSIQFGNSLANQRGRAFDRWDLNSSSHWKFKYFPPCEPTYIRKNSFLDICFIDDRLAVSNLTNDNKLKTLPFDSDHKAITFTVALPNRQIVPPATAQSPIYNFKATKWTKFQNHLNSTHNWQVPDETNLTQAELDKYLETLNNDLKKSIRAIVPVFKKTDNILIYITPKIKQLQKRKNQLITSYNRAKRRYPNLVNTHEMKKTIKELKILIAAEFKKAHTSYWKAIIKQIDHRDHTKFFPIINRVFRKKRTHNIDQLQIPRHEIDLLIR